MKGIVVAIIVVAILGALGYFIYASNQTKTEKPAAITQTETKTPTATPSSGQETQPKESEESNEQPSENKVTYTDSGFSPASLTIKSGENITWVNNAESKVQVGSASHPTHTVNQELTGNSFIIELAPGQSRTVQLIKKGEWGYHDHLRSGMTGTIIVE